MGYIERKKLDREFNFYGVFIVLCMLRVIEVVRDIVKVDGIINRGLNILFKDIKIINRRIINNNNMFWVEMSKWFEF